MKRPRIAGCSRLAKYHETPISSRMRMAYELCLATDGKKPARSRINLDLAHQA
jgi:hypothetical protein